MGRSGTHDLCSRNTKEGEVKKPLRYRECQASPCHCVSFSPLCKIHLKTHPLWDIVSNQLYIIKPSLPQHPFTSLVVFITIFNYVNSHVQRFASFFPSPQSKLYQILSHQRIFLKFFISEIAAVILMILSGEDSTLFFFVFQLPMNCKESEGTEKPRKM